MIELDANVSIEPLPHEDRLIYALRLQAAGQEEMQIRKSLRHHFSMSIDEFPEFFEYLEPARLRHIGVLMRLKPGQSDRTLIRKLSRNLGISVSTSEQLVARFKALDPDTPYLEPGAF